MHARLYRRSSPWAQHLEGSYFPADVLAAPEHAGRELWYLDNGSDHLIRSSHCNTRVVRWVLREHGISLAGPAPDVLVPPVPTDLLLDEVKRTMRNWGTEIARAPSQIASRWAQSFAVIAYARMLHTLRTRRVESKVAAVRWSRESLDERWQDLISRAWLDRPDSAAKCRLPAESADVRERLAFVQHATETTR